MRSKVTLPHFENNLNAVWWDDECECAKSEKLADLRQFRLTNSPEDLNKYISGRNRFKYICKTKRALYEANQRKMLISSRHSPGNFWKIVKHGTSTVSNNNSNEISAYEWYNYFKTLFSDRLMGPVQALNSEQIDEEKLEATIK